MNSLKKIFSLVFQRISLEVLFRSLGSPTVILLIIVNLIPLAGIIFFNWIPIDILKMYWVESVVIGIINVPKMLLSRNLVTHLYADKYITFGKVLTLFLVLFFIMHYGFFNYGHWMFLDFFSKVTQDSQMVFGSDNMKIFFIATMISHGFSFFYNYIGNKEYLTRNVEQQMTIPYQRIVILQITIVFGGFISLLISEYIIIVFVLVKIYLDIRAHINSHKEVFNSTNKMSGINLLGKM